MFIQILDAHRNPLRYISVILACLGRKNPDGSFEADDKFTREGGNLAWTWYPREADNPGGKYELRVNVYEPNTRYTKEVRVVTQEQLEGEQQIFMLEEAGTQPGPTPPPNGPQKAVITHNIDDGNPLGAESRAADDQWKAAYFAEASRLGVTTNNPANREKFLPWNALNGCKFQNQDRGDTRARLFLPPNPDGFQHTVNLGDDPGFGTPPAGPEGGRLKWEVQGPA